MYIRFIERQMRFNILILQYYILINIQCNKKYCAYSNVFNCKCVIAKLECNKVSLLLLSFDDWENNIFGRNVYLCKNKLFTVEGRLRNCTSKSYKVTKHNYFSFKLLLNFLWAFRMNKLENKKVSNLLQKLVNHPVIHSLPFTFDTEM